MTATTTTTPAPERVWKIREVAQHLGCTETTVYKMINEGALRAIRVGRLYRIPESALNDLIAGKAA